MKLLKKNPDWCITTDLRIELKNGVVVHGDGYNKYTYSGLNKTTLSRYVQPVRNIAWKQDVLKINWKAVLNAKEKLTGIGFTQLIIDAPWKFVGSDPVRGPSLKYSQINDEDLLSIPLGEIVQSGFVFMWIIPSKETLAKRWLEEQNFEICDRVTWIKLSAGNNMVTSLGLHFGKCREDILVGKKGNWQNTVKKVYFGKDVLSDLRRDQSQKPKLLHELVEQNVKHESGMLELFARNNNLRPNWTQIGLDLSEDFNRGFLADSKRFIVEMEN